MRMIFFLRPLYYKGEVIDFRLFRATYVQSSVQLPIFPPMHLISYRVPPPRWPREDLIDRMVARHTHDGTPCAAASALCWVCYSTDTTASAAKAASRSTPGNVAVLFERVMYKRIKMAWHDEHNVNANLFQFFASQGCQSRVVCRCRLPCVLLCASIMRGCGSLRIPANAGGSPTKRGGPPSVQVGKVAAVDRVGLLFRWRTTLHCCHICRR